MNPGFFNPYVITGFLTALSTLLIGIFVYTKNKNSSIHQSFLIYSLAIVEWGFFTALQAMQTELKWGLLWGKICQIGALLVPVFFYYFATKITGRPNARLFKIGLATALLLIVLTISTSYFIPTSRQDVGVNFMISAGPGYIWIITFFCTFVVLGLSHLWKHMHLSSGPRKKHLQYFFWASVLGYGLGIVNFFPVYGIMIPPYPYSASCGAIYFCVLAYAILKHKLFDIEQIAKKVTIFGILLIAVYAAVSTLIYTIGCLFKPPLPLLSGISLALAMLIYEPLRQTLTRLTDRFLHQSKLDYKNLIEQLTDRLMQIHDTSVLASEVVNYLTEKMGLEWAGLYIREVGDQEFKLRSIQNECTLFELSISHQYVSLIRNRKTPLVLSPFDTDSITPELKADLRKKRIEAIVPILVENNLYGFLLLGKKKSDEEFTTEDEALLQTLMEEVGMFFLSARLLERVNRSNLELGQNRKMTAVTQLARGVHHEVRNPLHIMIRFIENSLRYLAAYDSSLSPKSLFEKIEYQITILKEQVERIKCSLSRFSEFARPEQDDDFQCKPLNLSDEVKKFITLMREGQKLDRIKVLNFIPEHLDVLASEYALQAVLFNLFNNAFEAMDGKGELSFAAHSEDEWTSFSISDTGSGIPQKILPDIFEPYFTTKTHTESVGIGLTISKHQIERMGGTIQAEPLAGKGAKFTVTLPKAMKEEKQVA